MELLRVNTLPLCRNSDDNLQFEGTPVVLRVDYQHVLGKGGQGVVFRGEIVDNCGTLILKVRDAGRLLLSCLTATLGPVAYYVLS